MSNRLTSFFLLLFILSSSFLFGQDYFTSDDTLSTTPTHFELTKELEDSLKKVEKTQKDMPRGLNISSEQKLQGGLGYLLFGLANASTYEMADFLGNYQPQTTFITVGGGGLVYLNRWTIGGFGYGMIGNTFSTFEGSEFKHSMGGGGFEFGYDLKPYGNQRMIPFVVVGGSGVNLGYTQTRTFTEMELQALPERFRQEGTFTSGNLMMGAGINIFQLLMSNDTDQKGMGGMLVGLKIGANYVLPSKEWASESETFSIERAYSPSHYYFTLVLGGGGFGFK